MNDDGTQGCADSCREHREHVGALVQLLLSGVGHCVSVTLQLK